MNSLKDWKNLKVGDVVDGIIITDGILKQMEEYSKVVLCDRCLLTLDQAEVHRGVSFSKPYGDKQYCKSCHPAWPKDETDFRSLAHTRTFKSGKKVSYARIASVKDRVKSKDDNRTIISRSTGKQQEGWIGR